jgi:hypothetical protein
MSNPRQPTLPSPEEQDSAVDLLKNIGHAMVAWQGLESAVFDIFRYFFATDHWDAAATVFFTVQSFENRMQLIDALMAQFADKEKNEKWADLHKKIRKKSKTVTPLPTLISYFLANIRNARPLLDEAFMTLRNFQIPLFSKTSLLPKSLKIGRSFL